LAENIKLSLTEKAELTTTLRRLFYKKIQKPIGGKNGI
jgi:hypothetical protein